MNDDSFERSSAKHDALGDSYNYQSNRREVRVSYQRQPKLNRTVQPVKTNEAKSAFIYKATATTSTKRPFGRGKQDARRSQKKNANLDRGEEKLLRRQMRKQCKQEPLERQQNCTRAFELKFNLTSSASRKRASKNMAGSSSTEFSPSESRTRNNYVPIRNGADAQPARVLYNNKANRGIGSSSSSIGSDLLNKNGRDGHGDDDDEEAALKQSILQRTIRSHHRHQRRNATAAAIMSSHDFIYPNGAPIAAAGNETTAEAAAAAYMEHVDLNPELCYTVGGLSYGQQKICASHTQIMPAVSRGARAAIQVIQCGFLSPSLSVRF